MSDISAGPDALTRQLAEALDRDPEALAAETQEVLEQMPPPDEVAWEYVDEE